MLHARCSDAYLGGVESERHDATSGSGTKFDEYASSYEALHRNNIAASGEDPSYFHEHKIDCLQRNGLLEGPLLDFGCGVGNLLERFARPTLGLEVHGYDPSSESLAQARKRAPAATVHDDLATVPTGHFSTAVLSGVLHHVPPSERASLLASVRDRLKIGGKIVIFEHNPLNPLTRRAVAMCEFDDDAILLWPWECRRLLRDARFANVEHDYIVFFPKALSFLRRFEPRLRRVALGAQQMVVGERR